MSGRFSAFVVGGVLVLGLTAPANSAIAAPATSDSAAEGTGTCSIAGATKAGVSDSRCTADVAASSWGWITAETDESDRLTALASGQVAQLPFAATQGRRYRILLSESSFSGSRDLVVRMYRPDGTKLSESFASAGAQWFVDATQTGAYRVDVAPTVTAPGTVSIKVRDVSDLQLTGAVDGQDATIALEPGQNAQLSVPLTAGHSYRILLSESTFSGPRDLAIRILRPDGTKLSESFAAAGTQWFVDASQAGAYRIEIDPVVNVQGEVALGVRDISDLQLTTEVDGSDNVIALAPKQNAHLRFTATEGQRVQILMPAATVTGKLAVRIYRPDGTKLSDSFAIAGTQWFLDPAQAGTYRVEVDPVEVSPATVTLRVTDVSDVQQNAALEGPGNEIALAPGQNAQVRFTARKGQRIRIVMSEATVSGRLAVRIFGPDGVKLTESFASAGTKWDIKEAQAGIYRVEVDPVEKSPASLTLRFMDLSDLPVRAAVDGSDNVIALEPGQNAQLRFTATEGQRIRIQVPAVTVTGRLAVRIYRPDGVKLTESFAVAGTTWDIKDAQAGSYRVEVDPVEESAASVTLRITDLSDVLVAAAVDGSDNVMALEPGQNAQLRFTASEGQRIQILVSQATVTGRLTVRIYRPDGVKLTESFASAGTKWDIKGAQAGVYRVEVDPLENTASSVTVRVIPTDLG